jgi:hypothetical protein
MTCPCLFPSLRSSQPPSIPDRQSGCCEPDWESLELADSVLGAFSLKGAAPALVALKLHRGKLDANRARVNAAESPDGADGVNEALLVWDAYHASLEAAVRACVKSFGFCLLLDLHGQSHREDATELGYLLTSDDLLLSDGNLNAKPPRRSSVDSFLQVDSAGSCGDDSPGTRAEAGTRDQCRPGLLAELIRGTRSLGGLLARHGHTCCPSPEIPEPVSAESLREAKVRDLGWIQ